jgi:hypothetical protein
MSPRWSIGTSECPQLCQKRPESWIQQENLALEHSVYPTLTDSSLATPARDHHGGTDDKRAANDRPQAPRLAKNQHTQ